MCCFILAGIFVLTDHTVARIHIFIRMWRRQCLHEVPLSCSTAPGQPLDFPAAAIQEIIFPWSSIRQFCVIVFFFLWLHPSLCYISNNIAEGSVIIITWRSMDSNCKPMESLVILPRALPSTSYWRFHEWGKRERLILEIPQHAFIIQEWPVKFNINIWNTRSRTFSSQNLHQECAYLLAVQCWHSDFEIYVLAHTPSLLSQNMLFQKE